MTVLVRQAGPADMAQVYALRHQVFVVDQGVPAELELDELDAGCVHAVALLAGTVVGTGRLLAPGAVGVGPGIGIIGRLAVVADQRGHGVGAAVLGWLEGRALELGYHTITLHAQVPVKHFYTRAAYHVQSKVYLEAGIEHVTMTRRLVG